MMLDQHINCFACGKNNPKGLHLTFHSKHSGTAEGLFLPDETLQSYPAILHGGIQATLLDAAMVHALKNIGIEGQTAKLELRYLSNVDIQTQLTISATIVRQKGVFFVLKGMINQHDKTVTEATAIFRKR